MAAGGLKQEVRRGCQSIAIWREFGLDTGMFLGSELLRAGVRAARVAVLMLLLPKPVLAESLTGGGVPVVPPGMRAQTGGMQVPADVEMARVTAPDRFLRPRLRPAPVPKMRWAHRPEALLWTRTALAALDGHGAALVEMVPGDIAFWCPAYAGAAPQRRAAFWVGFLSALSKHESTYRPEAVGGGGQWYGLLQILPATARGYNCRARTGAALKDGAANLSCAIRIMARTVPRDGVIHAYSKRSKRPWRGVSADWGPLRSAKKRADIARWLRQQSFCRSMETLRPQARPAGVGAGTRPRAPD